MGNCSRTDWTAAAEVTAVFAAILAYIWWLRFVFSPAWVIILILILVSHRARCEDASGLGFRITGLKKALAAVFPASLLLVLILLALGFACGTVQSLGWKRDLSNLGLYTGWGLFQQYLLNGYFVNRLAALLRESRNQAAISAAVLFSAAHLPNLFLMLVALAGGYLCARLYFKFRNLYLLGILHGTVGFLLHLVVPGSLSHDFLVGPRYFGAQ